MTMSLPKYLFFLSILLVSKAVFAQDQDSLVQTEGPTVQVVADIIVLSDKSEKTINIAPMQKAMSLSQLLQSQSSFYIKQYGLGGLATISHQGNTAAQTEILWEGMPIHNPMVGQTDLNLQALFLVDKVALRHQDTESLLSGNALNTSLNLSSTQLKHTQLSALYQIGQYGQHKAGLDFNFGKGSFVSRSKIFGIIAKNNFKYTDINAFGNPKPIVHMPNNEQKQLAIAQDFFYDFSEYSQLSFKLFGQIAHRQLPPTLLQSNSQETQQDSSFRAIITYSKRDFSNRSFIKISQGFATESILYQSPSSESYSAYWQANTTVLWTYKISSAHSLQMQGQYQRLQANNKTAYAESPFQNRTALAALYKYKSHKWYWESSARTEYATNNKFLYALSSNIGYNITSKLGLNLYLAKQYRLPTFNDLYWALGGNPNLLPEESYMANFSITYTILKNEKHNLGLSAMPFMSFTDKQLFWLPSENSSLWTARNLNHVKSLGLHANLNYDYKLNNKFFVSLLGQYSFMQVEQAEYKDAQFLYTPKHNAVGSLRLAYKNKLALDYTHQYTSVRYIDNINARFLPTYQLANLSINYIYTTLKQQYHIGLVINNLFNEDYQIMANRPMPKRWLSLQLQATFLGKDKTFK